MMINHDPWLVANSIICSITAIRLLTFQRGLCRHRRWGGFIAYLLIFITASIPIRVALGVYPHADWSEVALNAVLMVSVIANRGNVVQVIKRFSKYEH